MDNDPYCYPGTEVLRNRFHILDPDVLGRYEDELSLLNLRRLVDHPVPGDYDLAHLRRFHEEIFGDLYPWAGQIRTVDIAKGAQFCPVQNIQHYAVEIFTRLAQQDHLRGLEREKFVFDLTELLGDLNALHPFREGNGRAQRAFIGQLARDAGYRIAGERLDGDRNNHASAASLAQGDNSFLRAMLDELVEGPG